MEDELMARLARLAPRPPGDAEALPGPTLIDVDGYLQVVGNLRGAAVDAEAIARHFASMVALASEPSTGALVDEFRALSFG